MLKLLRFIHLFYSLIVIALVFYLGYPLFWYYSRKKDNYVSLNKLRRRCFKFWLLLVGIRLSVKHEGKLPDGPVIFCPNHFSFLDIPTMIVLTGHNIFFMGKFELLKMPIFGFFFRNVDVPVPRGNNRGSYRAYEEMKRRILLGMSPVIFPEGGIKELMPKMGRFKNGAFKLAIEEQIPIVPVTLVTNQFLLYDEGKKSGSRPGKSFVIIHSPLVTKGLTLDDLLPLKEKTFNIIDQTLQNHAS